jgi:hypothetical protein
MPSDQHTNQAFRRACERYATDTGQDVDTSRLAAKHPNAIRPGQIVNGRRQIAKSEVNQRGAQLARALSIGSHEHVQILGESRLGVDRDRVSPDQKKPGSRRDQCT